MAPLLLVALAALTATAPQASPPPPSRPTFVAPRLSAPPTLDGVLDDAAWAGSPIETSDWESYNPLFGERVPQRTRVWLAYDADALYFAFECNDPDPSGIKTSIARRDNFGGDDWVGLSLDALGTGQLAYHMMVNPNGIQLDMLNSVAGDEDPTVDWVWQSAGRVSESGYAVEIRLPLRSIRFASGTNVRMGVLFWRKVSRLGMSVSWPALEPGRWVFDKHATLTLPSVEPRLPRDITPSATLSERQNRTTRGPWSPVSTVFDLGVTAKMGLSSTVFLDATANPDFSQVESDAFQVEVNQRFPLFYSERRPFFMEGAGIFALAGASFDNSLRTAVHTRRIVNPVAGLKLTGSRGRTTVATLSAVDELPPGSSASGEGRDVFRRLFNVARVQYSLGPSNYVGGLVTDVEDRDGHNRLAALDFSQRLSTSQRLTGTLLASHSSRTADPSDRTGVGGTFGYTYSSRSMSLSGSVEHYDRGFRMDTAFINRVGITSGWLYADHNFYPSGRWGWIRRITPFSFTQGGTDQLNEGGDLLEVTGVRANFTRQGFLRIDRQWGFEPWTGQRFARGRWRGWGEVQVTRWIKLDGWVESGRAVFYDPQRPFLGHMRRKKGGVTFQPGGRLLQSVSWDHVTFDRPATGEHVYTVNVVNTRTIYQFTRRLYTRALVQYDSARRRVLTDFLLSYEVNPGTIAYVGYGGLFHRLAEDGTGATGPDLPFTATDRGLLLKLSYLVRF